MASNQFFKIVCNGKSYYVKSSLSERYGQGIQLTLSDTVDAWKGEITEKSLDDWRKKTKMNQSDYKAATRAAMTGQSDGSSQFEYVVSHNKSNEIEFCWKQIISGDGIKIQLGGVKLQQCKSSEALQEIFEFVIEVMSSCKREISDVINERGRLANERETALKKLKEHANIKERTEKELFSKFALILNAKKEKLRQLKSRGSDLVESSCSADVEPVAGTSHEDSNGASLRTDRSLNMSDSEVDTDEEQKNKRVGNVRAKKTREADSEQKSCDISLVLGADSDVESDDDVVVKRRRTTKQTTKQASKPVIPRGNKASSKTNPADSTDRSRASVAKGSLRKLSSAASSASSNVNTNDLINNLA